ncbi:hypothetical protein [Singulisphaera sp. PoT]|uniref:hypothetical protein n=1 Tax=Singulisphaera sp. PoT TaxID=3411797 RepID=UPI003BF499F2
MKTAANPILYPKQAAERMGLALRDLVAIIRRHRYEFTEIKPGGKPGDRGPRRWGLTESQIAAIQSGQARKFLPPEEDTRVTPRHSPLSPDGKARLRPRLPKHCRG